MKNFVSCFWAQSNTDNYIKVKILWKKLKYFRLKILTFPNFLMFNNCVYRLCWFCSKIRCKMFKSIRHKKKLTFNPISKGIFSPGLPGSWLTLQVQFTAQLHLHFYIIKDIGRLFSKNFKFYPRSVTKLCFVEQKYP